MRSFCVVVSLCLIVLQVGACAGAPRSFRGPDAERALLVLVRAVQDADFRGDLAALDSLSDEMGRFVTDGTVARDARYWRGFALWRRALNGANESLPPESLLASVEASAEEFREALRLDSDYHEAMIGLAAALMNAAHFRYRDDPDRSSALMAEAVQLTADIRRLDPANPRLVFVAAGRRFWASAEAGGSRHCAVAEVEAALASFRSPPQARPLEPTWGEAELHMQLAFFKLNVTPPDPPGALRYARAALVLHPQWDYVKRILLPQVESAVSGQDSLSRATYHEEPRVPSDEHHHHEIDYIEFGVIDMAESQRFYAAAFGWEFTDYGPEYAGIRRRRGGEAGGLRVQSEVAAGGPLVILYTDDLETTLAGVRGAGGRITQEIFEFPGGRRFHFKDPSGNELAVWSAR